MTPYEPPAPTKLTSWPPSSEQPLNWDDLTPTGYPLCWLDEHACEYVLIRPLFVFVPDGAPSHGSDAEAFTVPRGTRCSALLADWELRSEFLRAHLRARGEVFADWLRGVDTPECVIPQQP